MQRFEALRTLTGAEFFDNVVGRAIGVVPSFGAAARTAARLNQLVADLEPRDAVRVIAGESIS